MPEFTAKDVQALRQSTGAGMMDAKKALQENGGDAEAATKWLREKGLAKAAAREDRDNSQGTVAVSLRRRRRRHRRSSSARPTSSPSPTSSPRLVQEIATIVAIEGEDAAAKKAEAIDDMKVVLKENIELGQVVRFEAGDGQRRRHLRPPPGRPWRARRHRRAGGGGTAELAHDIAVHIAFTKPTYLTNDEVPEAEVAAERETLEGITRAEGKPEAAIDKIVEGRLSGWFKDRVLLEQPYVKDDKQTIAQLLGGASIVRFAQVAIGG